MEAVRKDEPYLMLYVEDDPAARELVNTAISFKFRNIRVLTAEDGAMGLALYKEHYPDIVLTDIKMPVMDGLTMAAEIRKLRTPTVIAVMSAYCDTRHYEETAAQLGITDCVLKPVDFIDLFATITTCLAKVDSATQ